MAAAAVPLLLDVGVPENLAASVTAISGSIAVFMVIFLAYLSGKKNSRLAHMVAWGLNP